MKFILSPATILDLQIISEYTLETWGADQEEICPKSLWEKLATIQSAPEKYPVREDLVKGCRFARHEKHVIFFAIQGQTLQIIRILHGAMDFSNHLRGENVPE